MCSPTYDVRVVFTFRGNMKNAFAFLHRRSFRAKIVTTCGAIKSGKMNSIGWFYFIFFRNRMSLTDYRFFYCLVLF